MERVLRSDCSVARQFRIGRADPWVIHAISVATGSQLIVDEDLPSLLRLAWALGPAMNILEIVPNSAG